MSRSWTMWKLKKEKKDFLQICFKKLHLQRLFTICFKRYLIHRKYYTRLIVLMPDFISHSVCYLLIPSSLHLSMNSILQSIRMRDTYDLKHWEFFSCCSHLCSNTHPVKKIKEYFTTHGRLYSDEERDNIAPWGPL